MKFDFAIVGAGFAGCVCAERLASAGRSVLLIDKRPHIGGNAFDTLDEHGILIHPYGPHIFHTNSRRIFAYLSQFTDWRFYEHRVKASVEGALYPIPINRTTINSLYGWDLTEEQVKKYLEEVAEVRDPIATSEDAVLASVGRKLCETFFRGYTRKQWGLDLSELSASVAARIPTRSNDDDRYFGDTFQFMPVDGYTAMFERMIANPLITVELSKDFNDGIPGSYDHLIYTGPIDAFFQYRFGKLPYRSLRFEHVHAEASPLQQPCGTVNYPNDHSYTRITEFRHLTGQTHSGTSLVREYPTDEGEPYYPVPRKANEAIYKQYEALANETENVSFVGRLAQYRYYNMDQVVGAALAKADQILGV
jgi:UDP-galactopyranose mutase